MISLAEDSLEGLHLTILPHILGLIKRIEQGKPGVWGLLQPLIVVEIAAVFEGLAVRDLAYENLEVFEVRLLLDLRDFLGAVEGLRDLRRDREVLEFVHSAFSVPVENVKQERAEILLFEGLYARAHDLFLGVRQEPTLLPESTR
jgi:hypothetical protein